MPPPFSASNSSRRDWLAKDAAFPAGESICAVRANMSLAFKSKQRIILRNIKTNRALHIPTSTLAACSRARRHTSMQAPARSYMLARPPSSAADRPPLRDPLGADITRPSLCEKWLPWFRARCHPLVRSRRAHTAPLAADSTSGEWPPLLCPHALAKIKVRISLRALQAERQVDTAISDENPLAVAILASDTLVHRQPVYRDVQTPCNSRDTADRGLVAGLLFSASCLRPGATIARWMTASVPFEVP
jgi:hypothetical protein